MLYMFPIWVDVPAQVVRVSVAGSGWRKRVRPVRFPVSITFRSLARSTGAVGAGLYRPIWVWIGAVCQSLCCALYDTLELARQLLARLRGHALPPPVRTRSLPSTASARGRCEFAHAVVIRIRYVFIRNWAYQKLCFVHPRRPASASPAHRAAPAACQYLHTSRVDP